MTRPVAALTGGTGFLGRYVARALHEAGWQVRMLVRRDPLHPLLADVPLEIVPGDLDDAAALERLVGGSTAVVHMAGLVRARNATEFNRVNRDGAGAVAQAASRSAPEARLVLVSSQAARAPEVSPYAASKRAGEDRFVAAAGASPWVILRPPVIYGPWDSATPALLRLAAGPVAPVPWKREPRLALIHVCDAAKAVVACSDALAPSGRHFEISDGREDGYGWREILCLCAEAQDRRPPAMLPLPDGVMRLAGAAADGWSLLTRSPGFFGKGKAGEILHRDWFPWQNDRLPPSFWKAEIPARSGLRGMAEWLRAHPSEG